MYFIAEKFIENLIKNSLIKEEFIESLIKNGLTDSDIVSISSSIRNSISELIGEENLILLNNNENFFKSISLTSAVFLCIIRQILDSIQVKSSTIH